MRTNFFFLIVVLILIFGCRSSEDDKIDNDNTNSEKINEITFLNSSLNSNAVVTYTNGTTKTANFKDGKLQLPLSEKEDFIIKSIMPEGKQAILIGRDETDRITLNYPNGVLTHKPTENGIVPIGSYAEFQLIDKDNLTLSAKYKLEDNLDLMNEEWEQVAAGNASSNKIFKGEFDGGSFAITNLKMTTGNFGLFGEIQNAFIQNLTVKSGIIEYKQSNSNIGGGVFVTTSKDSKIKNCVNYANINSNNTGIFAGIVGQQSYSVTSNTTSIDNCKNYGNIVITAGTQNEIGGIVAMIGLDSSVITNCSNFGNISGNGSIAGIVGSASFQGKGNIENCTNSGKINSDLSNYYGTASGIIGKSDAINIIKNCINKGEVTGYLASGVAYQSGFIQNCSNSGKIVGNEIAAGIATKVYKKSEYNANTADVFCEKGDAAGIVNSLGEYSVNQISYCSNSYNTGKITGNSFVAGISNAMQWLSSRIDNCYNTGDITSTSKYSSLYNIGAGISTSIINVFNSYNTGKIITPITTNNPIESKYRAFAIGRAFGYDNFSAGNYWKDHTDDDAVQAFHDTQHLATIFSATNWPTSWTIGANGWKHLGSWNNGNPQYPKLYFEN